MTSINVWKIKITYYNIVYINDDNDDGNYNDDDTNDDDTNNDDTLNTATTMMTPTTLTIAMKKITTTTWPRRPQQRPRRSLWDEQTKSFLLKCLFSRNSFSRKSFNLARIGPTDSCCPIKKWLKWIRGKKVFYDFDVLDRVALQRKNSPK